jgi:hypothetical protein
VPRRAPRAKTKNQLAAVQAAEKVLNGPGSVPADAVGKTLCKAFVAAVKRYCADKAAGKKKGKQFNDYFFEDLRRIDRGLAAQVAREAPYLMRATSGSAGGVAVGLVSALRGTTAPAAGVANTVWNAMVSVTRSGVTPNALVSVAAGQFGAGTGSVFAALGSSSYYLRYADGVLNGHLIEIKGPTDSFNPTGHQATDNVAAGKASGDPTIGLTCTSCPGANCPPPSKCKFKAK